MNLRPPGYEPGELPDCSTPRRGGQYSAWAAPERLCNTVLLSPSVSALAWSALGFFLFVLLVTAVGLGVLGLRGWRQAKALRSTLLASIDDLNASITVLERRLESVELRSVELQRSLNGLSDALARARVLLGAAQDVRDVLMRARAVIPQK